jgi:hypothetical protein
MAVADILGDLLDGDETSGLDRSEILGDDALGDDSGLEFVGDESFGDDVLGDDVLGAVLRKRKSQKNQALAAALQRRRAAAGTLVRDVRPRSSREYALGLGSTSVLGNSSANINVQPQVVFRPERLVVPSNVALDFLITDIKVGKNSQLASTGAVPATAFTEQAFGVRLKMDTAQISMFVTLSVTNTNPNARNFQGVIIGPAVE